MPDSTRAKFFELRNKLSLVTDELDGLRDAAKERECAAAESLYAYAWESFHMASLFVSANTEMHLPEPLHITLARDIFGKRDLVFLQGRWDFDAKSLTLLHCPLRYQLVASRMKYVDAWENSNGQVTFEWCARVPGRKNQDLIVSPECIDLTLDERIVNLTLDRDELECCGEELSGVVQTLRDTAQVWREFAAKAGPGARDTWVNYARMIINRANHFARMVERAGAVGAPGPLTVEISYDEELVARVSALWDCDHHGYRIPRSSLLLAYFVPEIEKDLKRTLRGLIHFNWRKESRAEYDTWVKAKKEGIDYVPIGNPFEF